MRRFALAALTAALVPQAVGGQSYTAAEGAGQRIVLEDAREIALARSAAPPEVSADATVLVYRPGAGYDVAVRGAGSVTCLVDRSRVDALEPHCYDREGSATIL